ncbi:MAG: hypothetical protein Q9223_005743 [Gallowayella weberi]
MSTDLESLLPYGSQPLGGLCQIPIPSLHEPDKLRLRRIREVIALADSVDAGAIAREPEVLEPKLEKIERSTEHVKYRELPERMLQDLEKQIYTRKLSGTPDDRGNLVGRHALRLICLIVLLFVLAWQCKTFHA